MSTGRPRDETRSPWPPVLSPRESVVVDNRAGAGIATRGPLHAEEEYVSGIWIIEAQDRTEALALAAQASKACNRRIELRPFL